MGININWSNIGWTESDDFIHFAFGDFNSKTFSTNGQLVRTSDGNRFNIHLAPTMNDKVVDIPGGDGQYYFGTNYKAKTIDISFAFKNLNNADLWTLRDSFSGNEIRELCFAEDYQGGFGYTYMAKVTSMPTLKLLSFGDSYEDEIYNGEGTIQFTAFYPFKKGRSHNVVFAPAGISAEHSIGYNGRVPAHFILECQNGSTINSIMIDNRTISQKGAGIAFWDSKTGIIKDSGGNIIDYNGCGVCTIAYDRANNIKIQFNNVNGQANITYNDWYY